MPSTPPATIPLAEFERLIERARLTADAAYANIVDDAPELASGDHWMPRVLRITQEAASLKSRYRKLVRWADETAAKIAPHAQCRQGCAHCCHIAVSLTEQEAAFIGETIGKVPKKPARAPALGRRH